MSDFTNDDLLRAIDHARLTIKACPGGRPLIGPYDCPHCDSLRPDKQCFNPMKGKMCAVYKGDGRAHTGCDHPGEHVRLVKAQEPRPFRMTDHERSEILRGRAAGLPIPTMAAQLNREETCIRRFLKQWAEKNADVAV